MTDVVVVRVRWEAPEVRALVAELDAELRRQYPEPGANHFRLDPEEVAPGRGAFFMAHLLGRPAGCGAVRLVDPDSAELKRMYTVPAVRGRGVASAILAALEAEARALGAKRVVLETGVRQTEALALYRSRGYAPLEPFGEYVGKPLSLCLAKTLEGC